jgi:hypothetical protein
MGLGILATAAVCCLSGSRLDGLHRQVAKAGSFELRPAFEFVGVGDLEAIEEGTGIQLGRTLEISARLRLEKVGEIAAELGGIGQQLPRFGTEEVMSQLAPEAVERLGQRMTGFGFGRVGPEEEQEPVAADAMIARGDDRREESKPLGGWRPQPGAGPAPAKARRTSEVGTLGTALIGR